MYKQLMNEPYCMLASDIDGLTIAQFLLYFTSEEDVKGVKELSKPQLKKILEEGVKAPMSREEFLKRGEEIRKKKKAEFEERRQKRIEAAKGGKRVK